MGVYPFMFGSVKDFQPVVDKLIDVSAEVLYIVVLLWFRAK